MKRMVLLVVVVTLTACATSASEAPSAPKGQGSVPGAPAGVTFAGGSGLSCESRVVIRGAADEKEGIASEHAWLESHYPGYKLKQQGLAECKQHATDIMSITTPDRRGVEVYFDISAFF